MTKTEALVISGTVKEALADSRFIVKLENGVEVLCYLAGKLRRFNIRVVIGDTVEVALSPYDLTRGRITYRQR